MSSEPATELAADPAHQVMPSPQSPPMTATAVDVPPDSGMDRTELSRTVAAAITILVPGGPVTLCSIHPAGGMGPCKTFDMPAEAAPAGEWAANLNASGLNMYWMPNLTGRRDCRVTADDVGAARFVWVDADPKISTGGSYNDARRDLYERLLPRLKPVASVVVDSGNGLQALLRLDELVPLQDMGVRENYISINREIGEVFEGPSTFNPDRILRLPGTLNFPSKSKIAKGYPEAPRRTKIIYSDDRTFGPEQLQALISGRPQPVVPRPPVDPVATRFSAFLAGNPQASHRYQGGVDGLVDTSGSARDMSMVSMLKAGGFALDEVKQVLAGWPHGSTGGRQQGDRYWTRMWSRADTAPPVPQVSGNGYRLFKASELSLMPPVSWRIHGILPERGLASIYGASGSGKTFLALDLAAHLVTGQKWFGHKTVACPVVYIALEGAHGISQRVQAWQAHHKTTLPDSFRVVMDHVSLFNDGDVERLADAILATYQEPMVVVIDTLNQSAPGADENNSKDMGRIISRAQALERLTDSTVCLVHHAGKDQSKGLRGHSSLLAALDLAIEVQASISGWNWSVAKSKDSQSGITYGFELTNVGLGNDQNGDPVSSRVVTIQPLGLTRTTRQPSGANQKVALRQINSLFQRIPLGTQPRSISVDDAIEAVAAALVFAGKHRRDRAASAITGLIAAELLEQRDERLWLP